MDAGDFDGDGDLDLFLTHLTKEKNTLYRNDGRGLFDDHSQAAGLAAPSLPYTAFGTAWIDYDNDGWLDLLVVNGAVTLLPDEVRAGRPVPAPPAEPALPQPGAGRGRGGGRGALRGGDGERRGRLRASPR